MMRSRLCVLAPALPLVWSFSQAIGTAQTRWVHINHRPSGNIIITPVNLNIASKADLMRLPGISEAAALRIIDGRPYQTKTELADREIVAAETYRKIEGRIVAPKDE